MVVIESGRQLIQLRPDNVVDQTALPIVNFRVVRLQHIEELIGKNVGGSLNFMLPD
jgi:hypothetical protein